MDLRLYVSVKRLTSGISQQGLAASQRLGSAAVSDVFTVKTPRLERDMVAAHADNGDIFFELTFQTCGTGRN